MTRWRPSPSPSPRRADRAFAALLFLLYAAIVVQAAFNRREFFDTVGYALPGANLVERGTLSLPQLGDQLGLDRVWLLNAPFIVLGPVPGMALLGAGRIPNVLGVVILALANGLAFIWALRRALPRGPLTIAVLAMMAFLLHRNALGELYNQRYTVATFALMALAFAPPRENAARHPPSWQWLAAGALPLMHPSLALALAVWCLARVVDALRPDPPAAPWPRLGPLLFLIALGLAVAWYGRVEAFETQFLTHLRFGNYRASPPWVGLTQVYASPIAGAPSWALNALIVAFALAVLVAAPVRLSQGGPAPRADAWPPALAIALALALDGTRGFLYAPYYLLGLGPPLVIALAGPRARRGALAALALIALGHLAISSRLDRAPPDWTTTRQAREFVLDYSRPGDRIVLGPPFVLVAAPARLPDDRAVPRVVPMDYYLGPFDAPTFLRDIRAHCNLYIGEEEWFYRAVWVKPERGEPIFPNARLQRVSFRGRTVLVARPETKGPPPP